MVKKKNSPKRKGRKFHLKEEEYIKTKGIKIAISWGMEDREKEKQRKSIYLTVVWKRGGPTPGAREAG